MGGPRIVILSDGEIFCSSCSRFKKPDEFGIDSKSSTGRRYNCKMCRNAIERSNYSIGRAAADKLVKRYGPDAPQVYERLRIDQEYSCAICGIDEDDLSRALDLDHKGKVFRGLLCNNCNRGLGHFKDDPVLLRSAADYLESRM